MYDDWASLSIQLGPSGSPSVSVLSKLPADEARRVVTSVVKTVASQLGLASPKDAKPSPLSKETEVIWFMEVICYGLTLPLGEHETIKDCVNVYCEWLSTLLPEPKTCVPAPILEEPNKFSRRILQHLYHIFVPRKDESAQDSIHRQAVLCHRVLRRVQDIARQSQILERETWESILGFLLASNDALLSPPTVKDDVGDQLCERVLGVLYEIWLVSCVKCFPSPSLWKTFREMCLNWRHRLGLVDQWSRVTMALTSRLLFHMSGPGFPQMAIETDTNLIPNEITYDCIAQTWFRFLHSLGNPVELSRPSIIAQTQAFYQYAIVAENVIDPSHHPCLNSLPAIFLKAMRGLASIVDAFLGMPKANLPSTSTRSLLEMTESYDAIQSRFPHPDRPKCNSILHLCGSWLFEAAFIGSDYCKYFNHDPSTSMATSTESASTTPSTIPAKNLPSPSPRPHNILKKTSSVSVHSTTPSISMDPQDLPGPISTKLFESGRAEALGALCRIFCSKKTGEEISPMYLARFYLSLQQGLQVGPDRRVTDALAMILLNSSDLLRVDLKGVNVILPDLVQALEVVLGNQDLRTKGQDTFPTGDLRRASISIVISMIYLPLHFQGLTIKRLHPGLENTPFKTLWSRITNLIFTALQVETDPKNSQLLLGGLMHIVQESEGQRQSFETPESNTDEVPKVTISDSSSIRSQDNQNEEVFFPNDDSNSSGFVAFGRATHLVCHRLISSWKSDLTTSLAALELLKGLARVRISNKGTKLECKRSVKWLCDYIVAQCSRPPPAHSKDLHSSIVAAFQCLKVWLARHPYLLYDKETLATVLEVVELGISGSKSQAKASDPPLLKENKTPQPASKRVRDAAESLLNLVLEEVDFFPSSCGAESVSTLMDESSLMRLSSESLSLVEASQHFRYFVVDRSILLAVLEDIFTSEDDPPPTVSVLIRGATGRSCWTLQLRHLPRHKSGLKPSFVNPGRPLPMEDVVPRQNVRPSFFPDSIDRIPLCKADHSIPAVESVALDARASSELEYLSRLMQEHTAIEGSLASNGSKENSGYSLETECRAPEPCHEFQTTRLLLSHLGLLNTKALKESLESPVPQLVALESSSIDFVNDLESLDRLSPRTADTVQVFYMKSGQKGPDEILNNVLSANSVHPHFLEFLSTLGWPINVWKHPGWTGHVSTSWRIQSELMRPPDQPNHGGAIFNGDHYALYWADETSEIVFLVPALGSKANRKSSNNSVGQPSNADYDYDYTDGSKSARKLGRQVSSSPVSETRTIVVWLENFEDHLSFPLSGILNETDSYDGVPRQRESCCIIYAHPLGNGLIRVKLVAHKEKVTTLATPLVDGMVVSRRSLGPLVRQTVLNVAARRRLDQETYQPPHVKRKQKIQEIVEKYRSPMLGHEFYAQLFTRRFAV